jgi:hypothetical protein
MSLLQSLFDRIDAIGGLFFDEPELARYVTVPGSDAGFTIPDPVLQQSDRHIQDIHAPGLIGGSLPVIFFRTRHTGNPTFSVRLNTTPLIQHTLAESGPHSWHEIVPAVALKPQNNELTLGVSGEGVVTFSDVVILYRSNQLTVRRPLVLAPPEP